MEQFHYYLRYRNKSLMIGPKIITNSKKKRKFVANNQFTQFVRGKQKRN